LGREVVPVDLPGHGARADEIDARAFSLETTLEGIEHSLSAEKGLASLVGYSMGGRIALQYAYRHPGRLGHLVLESASPGLATAEQRAERRAADEELAAELERDGIEAFVDRWEALPLFTTQRGLPAAIGDDVRTRRLLNRAGALAAALRGLGTGALPSLWDVLPRIGTPTLVLVGGLDDKFVEIGRRMVALLPQASLHVVPDAGHAVHLERPQAWARAVGDFLERPKEAR
jgi:2-succinyl-6-hydroxy-2,4-cyclohexadiene-1-carboxylate synthase